MSLPFKRFTLSPIEGFTLIELLVVISILGIMAAVGLLSYTTVLNKVRDTKIKADLDAIGKAYEFRYNFSTNTYGDVLPADFDSGQIPKKPNGSYYPACSSTGCSLPTADKTTFKICVILSDGTSEYCHASIRKEPPAGVGYGGSHVTFVTEDITCSSTDATRTPTEICAAEADRRGIVAGSSFGPKPLLGGSFFARGHYYEVCGTALTSISYQCPDFSCDPTFAPSPVVCRTPAGFSNPVTTSNLSDTIYTIPNSTYGNCVALPLQRWIVRVSCGW